MNFLRSFKRLFLYLDYILKVSDEHSLQAPYIFSLYSELKQGKRNFPGFDDIESLRQDLKKDHTIISGKDYGAGSKITGNKTVSSIAISGVSDLNDCRTLSQLLQITKPKTILELGTSVGISTAYICKTLPDSQVISLEGNEQLVQVAKENLQSLNIKNAEIIHGNIDDILDEVLRSLSEVDFVLIDANHRKDPLLKYFNKILPELSTAGCILIDDIRWSGEMYSGWQKICKNENIALSIEMLDQGLLINKKELKKQHYVLSV